MAFNLQHIVLLQQSFALLTKITPDKLEAAFRFQLGSRAERTLSMSNFEVGFARKLMFRMAYVIPRLENWNEVWSVFSDIIDHSMHVSKCRDLGVIWIAMSENLLSTNWNPELGEAWKAFFLTLEQALSEMIDREFDTALNTSNS